MRQLSRVALKMLSFPQHSFLMCRTVYLLKGCQNVTGPETVGATLSIAHLDQVSGGQVKSLAFDREIAEDITFVEATPETAMPCANQAGCPMG